MNEITYINTPNNRMSVKDWAEKFKITPTINCPGWSNVTDIGEVLEQSSAEVKQPKSPEIVGTGLSGRADSAEFQLGQCFARSGEMQRLSKELQKFAQTLSHEKPCIARVDELRRIEVRQKKYGSRINSKTIKLQNYRHKSNFTKRGHT